MIFAPSSALEPFLYDSRENERLTSVDDGQLVAEAIEELRGKGLKVRSIVGNDLPAEVSTLVLRSTKSRLRGENAFLNRAKYSPCPCHFMDLVVSDCIVHVPSLQALESILQDLMSIADSSEVYDVMQGRCPHSAKTR
jgi:hypothetical protein